MISCCLYNNNSIKIIMNEENYRTRQADEEFLNFLQTSNSNSSKLQEKTTPYTAMAIVGSVIFATYAAVFPFVSPALRKICIPYVPATNRQIHNIKQFFANNANHRPMRVIDLGSGDGRIVFELAKMGHATSGVELNRWLVYWSKLKSIHHKQQFLTRPKFICQDLFKVNLSTYDCVILFGVDSLMPAIVPKIKKDLNDSAYFLACRFPLPSEIECVYSYGSGIDRVWVYSAKSIKKIV